VSDWSATVVTALERLAELARRDEDARGALEALGHALIALAAAPMVEAAPADAPAEPPTLPPPHPQESLLDIIRRSVRGLGAPEPAAALAPPALEKAPAPVSAPRAESEPAVAGRLDIEEVRDLAALFHAKTAAARWASSARAGDAARILELPSELAARLERGAAWFCEPLSLHNHRQQDYDTLASAFAAAAEALEYMDLTWQASGEADLFEPVQLLAEAQSTVRSAARALRPASDPEQERTHWLLRNVTRELSIYVPRYMKLDDLADPAGAVRLLQRIQSLTAPIRDRRSRERETREARSRLDYHLESLAEADGDDAGRHWAELTSAIELLVQGGFLRPSDRDLRERLLPLLDRRPAGPIGPGMAQVLREIDRYLASQERGQGPEAAAATQSADVRRVAEKLRGRSVVLIAGERRVEHEERLERAFGLSELVWLEGFGLSYTKLEDDVARGDVAMVLLAVRWASHESGNVKKYCEQYGKPLVMLRAGYNENQVAAQVIAQAGQRLAL
jgi:hypothetical protein